MYYATLIYAEVYDQEEQSTHDTRKMTIINLIIFTLVVHLFFLLLN